MKCSSFFVQCDRTASLPHQFRRWYAIVQMRYSNWEIKSYTEIIQGFFKNLFCYSALSVSWGIFWNPARYCMTLFTLPYILNNSQALCNPLGDSYGHSKGNSGNYILTHLNIILKVFKTSSLRHKMYSIYFDQIYLCE